MDYGYTGKILRVDLSRGETRSDTIDQDARWKYIGGRGLGLHLLAREISSTAGPYDPDTPLIFMTGPYTGSGVFSAFYNVTTLSPLTGLAASSHSGGTWGPHLKMAGFDALVITGKAPEPTYLLVEEGGCRLVAAGGLWGQGVRDTETRLRQAHPKHAVACIGPAGEKLVRYAAIMNDIHRAAGRGGVGAVMGAKNLKAVVAGGSHKIAHADREAFTAISRQAGKTARQVGAGFAKYGTSVALAIFNAAGALPVRNFSSGHFEAAEMINAEALKNQYFVRDQGCFKCPLRCSNIHRVPDGPFAVEETEGPEYETLMSFGSNCGNANLASIIKANDVCNDLGMDCISAGNTIAMALDIGQRGGFGPAEAGDLDFSWGNPHVILRMLEMIATRQGLGDLMAEGSLRMGRALGAQYERLAIHTKGQEFPGYEVRRAHGTGLSFATSSRGADHLRGCMYVDELIKGELDPMGFSQRKIETLIEKENLLALVDSLVMCKFGQRNGGFTEENLPAMLKALTGFDYTPGELVQVGERVYNLERVFNLPRMPEPDVLPRRLLEDRLDDDLAGGDPISPEEFQQAVQDYYQKRGWDGAGKPGEPKLSSLSL